MVLVGGVLAAGLSLTDGPLNGDVRYEAGTQLTSPVGPVDTFTHRPLAYRLLMAALMVPAGPLADRQATFERVLRLEAGAICVIAGLLLYAGLRRYHPAAALPAALAVTAATWLVTPALTLEPDWVAVPLVSAAVGVALLPGRRRLVAGLAGALLAAAAAVKVVTLLTALVGLVVLLALDRRRAGPVLVAATVVGLAYAGVVAVLAPHEYRWLADASVFQPRRPAGEPTRLGLAALGNAAVLWPAVVAIPASLVRANWAERGVIIAAAGLTWLQMQLQQQFYIYHLAPFAVVAAGCLVRLTSRSGGSSAVVVVAWSLVSGVLLTRSTGWRLDHQTTVFVAAGVVALTLVALQVRRRAPVIPARPGLLASLVVLTSLTPALLPGAAWSYSLPHNLGTTTESHAAAADRQLATGRAVRERTGGDSTVTYLTFGDVNFAVANPTDCRFPTNVFLQRSRYSDRPQQTRTWADNLTCLTGSRSDHLVWDPHWFATRKTPREVQAAVAAHFDCTRFFVAGPLTVCPRRA